MQAMDVELLKKIAAKHGVTYETPSPILGRQPTIKTIMARTFPCSQELLYEKISDLKDHTRLFSHLTAINVISSSDVANVIGPNQFVIVEGIAEGGSKLGVKLMTVTPPDRIECELFTDLFSTAEYTMADKKSGAILWKFEKVGANRTTMRIESEFQVGGKTAYVRGAVDHVWLDFFENVMVDFGELALEQKQCAPFPGRRNR